MTSICQIVGSCIWRGWIVVAGFLAIGCAVQDPQALIDLHAAKAAIHQAKEAKAAERFPEKFAVLEQEYLQARGMFYACYEDESSRMAQILMEQTQVILDLLSSISTSQPASFSPSENPYYVNVPGFISANAPPHTYTAPGWYLMSLRIRDNFDTGRANMVFFDFDKTTLKVDVDRILTPIVNELIEYPHLRLIIVGFTDSIGTKEYNQSLSVQRAESVKKFFINRGIAAERLDSKGEGLLNPIASNLTEGGRARNRRAEISVQSIFTR